MWRCLTYINAYECGPVVWRRFGDPLRKGSHEWQVLKKLQTDEPEPEPTVFQSKTKTLKTTTIYQYLYMLNSKGYSIHAKRMQRLPTAADPLG